MTDVNQVEDIIQNQNQETPQEVQPIQPQVSEEMIPKSRVNQIVAEEKARAKAKAEREMREQFSKSQEQQSQGNMGGIPQFSEEHIRKMVLDEADKAARMEIAKRIIEEFQGKLELGANKYSDFTETVQALELAKYPELVHLSNSLDNTADVLYDIAKNPSKFANVLVLSTRSPQLARNELNKLSNSIKLNEQAQNVSRPAEPLSQLRASTTGRDSGELSVRDFKKMPWLRG